MRSRYLGLILLIALFLAGCRAQTTPEAEQAISSPTTSATATKVPAATPTVAKTATDAAGQAANANTPAEPGCTVVSRNPTPTPDPASPFFPIADDEWSVGPENASITLIEYADFQ